MRFSVGADGITADAPTLVFSRVGVGKEGEGTCLVGSLPLSFLLCGADDGSRTRCLHLGRVALFLVSYICICVPRLFERCQLACLCVAGFGADDGA